MRCAKAGEGAADDPRPAREQLPTVVLTVQKVVLCVETRFSFLPLMVATGPAEGQVRAQVVGSQDHCTAGFQMCLTSLSRWAGRFLFLVGET